jgi:hypothetical protein
MKKDSGKEVFREEIIFKTTITRELDEKNRITIRNIMRSIELLDADVAQKVRSVVLREVNDFHRGACDIISRLFEKAVDS